LNTQNKKHDCRCKKATAVLFRISMVFKIDGIEIEYVKKPIKSLRLKIDRNGKVYLVAPKNMPDKIAFDFLHKKIGWVKQKISVNEDRLLFNFKNGEKFYIFGKEYRLTVVLGQNKSGIILNDEVLIFAKDDDAIKVQLVKLLKEVFYQIAKERLDYWANKTGLNYSSFTIRKTVSTWGSCNSSTRAINLSLYLVFTPLGCLDYVALHEICHLKHANHGAYFKNMLSSNMSKWKEIRKFLNDNRNKYIIEL
jgi:predicted metal-dependent hydrolase